jgi:hypothetical protein
MSILSHAHLLSSCIQAIALFNANQHKEAMLRIQELTAVCPNDDTLACHVVEVSIMYSIRYSFVC